MGGASTATLDAVLKGGKDPEVIIAWSRHLVGEHDRLRACPHHAVGDFVKP